MPTHFIIDRKNRSPARTILYFLLSFASFIGAVIFGGKFFTEKLDPVQPDLPPSPAPQNSSDATIAFFLIFAGILFLVLAVGRLAASED